MATVVYDFGFSTSADGWSGFATRSGGQLYDTYVGRNLVFSYSYSCSYTFEQLGVPAGATVTGISVSLNGHYTTVNVAAATVPGLTLGTAGGAAVTVSALTTSSANYTGSVTGLSLASSASAGLTASGSGKTGNHASGTVEVPYLTGLSVTVTYQESSAPIERALSATATASSTFARALALVRATSGSLAAVLDHLKQGGGSSSPPTPRAASFTWASSGVTQLTVSLPSDVADGELLVLVTSQDVAGVHSLGDGSWTAVGGGAFSTSVGSAYLWTKVWRTGDSTTVVLTSTVSERLCAAVIPLSGHDGVDVWDTTESATSPWTCPSATTTVGNAYVLRIVAEEMGVPSGNVHSNAQLDAWGQGGIDSGTWTSLWGAAQASAGSTGTAAISSTLDRDARMFTVAIKPASGTGPIVRLLTAATSAAATASRYLWMVRQATAASGSVYTRSLALGREAATPATALLSRGLQRLQSATSTASASSARAMSLTRAALATGAGVVHRACSRTLTATSAASALCLRGLTALLAAVATGGGLLTHLKQTPVSFLRQHTLESGQPDGTTITAANSATGGDAFNLLSATAPVYSTAQANRGDLSAYVNADAACNLGWSGVGGVDTLYIREYLYLSNLPSAATRHINVTNGSGTIQAVISVTTTNGLQLLGVGLATMGTLTSAVTTGEWNRVELKLTSTGDWEIRTFKGANVNGTTPDASTSGNGNVGSGYDRVSFGAIFARSGWRLYLDDLALSDTDWCGSAADGPVVIERLLAAVAQGTGLVMRSLLRVLGVPATTTATLSTAQAIARLLEATASAGAHLVRSLGRALAGAVTSGASSQRQLRLVRAAAAPASAALAAGRRFVRTLTATAATLATLARESAIARTLVAGVQGTAQVLRSLLRGLRATATGAGTYQRRVLLTRGVSATAATTALLRGIQRVMQSGATTFASLTRRQAIERVLTAGAAAASTLRRHLALSRAATVAPAASYLRQLPHLLAASANASAALGYGRALFRQLTASATTLASAIVDGVGVLVRPLWSIGRAALRWSQHRDAERRWGTGFPRRRWPR
jgi:hypothetical protein